MASVSNIQQSLRSTAEVMSQATLQVLFNDFILFTRTTLHSAFLQGLPRGLCRGSAAARLLRLRVRISPRAWMFVCCEWCIFLQVEVSATNWSLIQRHPTESGVSEGDCETSKSGGPGPLGAVVPQSPRVTTFLILSPWLIRLMCSLQDWRHLGCDIVWNGRNLQIFCSNMLPSCPRD